MSGRVVGRIFERIIGSPVDKAVLTCLGEHANPDGEMAFPSVRRIALETELSERSVRGALSRLRKRLLIIQTSRASQHRTATYRVNLEALSDLQVVQVYIPDLQVVPPRPAGGATQTCRTCHPDLQVVHPNRPITIQEEPSKEPPDDDAAELFALLVRAWETTSGPITPGIAEDLGDLAEDAHRHIHNLPPGAAGAGLSGEEWVCAAIQEARVSSDGRRPNVKFVQRILERWTVDGFKATRERGAGGRPGTGSDAIHAWAEGKRHGNH